MLPFPYGIQQINTGPLVNSPNLPNDLTDVNNQVQSARVINPVTQDYELNSNGTFTGQSAIQTSVYLALFTVFNSSAVSGLGVQFNSIKVITPNINKQIFNVVQQALASLINQGLCILVSCNTTNQANGQLAVQVDWQVPANATVGQNTFTTNILLPISG
jgi:phage gp46-like protein